MDKLIVTILGIGLSAAIVVASADYLSTFYLNMRHTALAQKWVSEAAQIAVAARQAGALTKTGDNWRWNTSTTATAGALVPTYLSDLPRHNDLYVFRPCQLSTSTGYTLCPYYTPTQTAIVAAVVENMYVCQEIQKLANRGLATIPTVTVSGTSILNFSPPAPLPINSPQRFTCVQGTSNYYFLYRVFMDH